MKKVLICLSLVLSVLIGVAFAAPGVYASEYEHPEGSFFEFLTSSENKYAISVNEWIAFNNVREVTIDASEKDGIVDKACPYYSYTFTTAHTTIDEYEYTLDIQTFYKVVELDPNEESHKDFALYFYIIVNRHEYEFETGFDFEDNWYYCTEYDNKPLLFTDELDSLKFAAKVTNRNQSVQFTISNKYESWKYEKDLGLDSLYDLNFDINLNNTRLMKSYNLFKEKVSYNDGYDAGYSAGIKETDYENIYETGWTDGANSVDTDFIYNEGFKAGEASGTTSADKEKYFNDGYDAGFVAGADSVDTNEFYQQGFQAGQEQANDKTFFDYIVEFFKEIGDFFKELFS